MKFYLSFILLCVTFFGCKKDNGSATVDYAYIGGEIINPNTKYVVLSKNETIIDTINLDGRNRFLYKIKNLSDGIYNFRHGGEYQMVLLEPQDSVLFRLNTLDFDESLVFSGKGSKKNNYLIETFLESEAEEQYIIKLCQLSAEDYQKHIDSIRDRKTEKFNQFVKKHHPSDLFKDFMQANINYSYYSSKEVYPFLHYGKNKAEILKSVPANFYDYRKDINYNDVLLSNYHNYMTFLRHSVSNLTLEKHDAHSTGKPFHRGSTCYNLDRLHLIDSLVTNEAIKNELLFKFTMYFLSKSNNEKNNEAILGSYIEKSTNEKDKDQLTRYVNSINNLKAGAKLPELTLISYNKAEQDLHSIINKPSVISFWSTMHYEHFKKSHKQLRILKEKYPELKFITINIDGYGIDKSKQILQGYNFDYSDEYLFKNPDKAIDILAMYPITKTIIVDRKGKVVNGNSNIFSISFEKEVLGLLNR
ncbi:hypothetical protein KFZ70_13165 [Tamlana fucoidanivorans]|uniref:Thioredoxin domain-containing protein n=1 Tax=Allotamlana fucoidanivorans TaxID=2583814 RepID=A0A5C4SRW4_9FLAO|nr:hypothetical protein [Tamlana fucoidanivorans]TNJ46381.1 hypothetical protein FGF67_01790 [Tamlana fucoidanivorans]